MCLGEVYIRVWIQRKVPEQCRMNITASLFKSKGDRCERNSHRGVGLLSEEENIYEKTTVLIKRTKD